MNFKRIIAFLLGGCFILFAALQYNDHNAIPWVATYLAAAILSFLAGMNRISQLPLLIAFVAYAFAAVYFWPAKWEGLAVGGGDINNIEEARESLGMAICSLSMLGFALLGRSKGRPQPHKPMPEAKKWAN